MVSSQQQRFIKNTPQQHDHQLLPTPRHIALFLLAREYISTVADDDETDDHLAQRLLRCLDNNNDLSTQSSPTPEMISTYLASASVLAAKVAPDSPVGLLLRRLALAGQTLSFESLCALQLGTTTPPPPPPRTDLALRIGRQPFAELASDANQLVVASRVCRDLGRAVDLNHATNTDTQAALLSLATLLGDKGTHAAEELVRVAQQHADDVMLAHATAYCSQGMARASAAALHLPHVVAYCDVRDGITNPGTVAISLSRLSHAVRLVPHSGVESLYTTIPRAPSLHGTEHALSVAIDRMHATAALLLNSNTSSYIVSQANLAANALGVNVPTDDVALAYAQLASNAAQWDLNAARRLLDVAAARLPYDTGATLAAARDALAFDTALGAHDWAAAEAHGPNNSTQRTLLYLYRGDYALALEHAPTPLLTARVLLRAGDWSDALHHALEALLHTADAEAAVALAEALLAGGHSASYAMHLLRDAVPVLTATRRAWALAKAHCLLAAVEEEQSRCDAHLQTAAELFAQVGAWADAAEAWQLLAMRAVTGDARQACAGQARKCLLLLVHHD